MDEFAEFDVTCHTVGCTNSDVTLRVWVDVHSLNVFCGPCEQPITDIVPVEEE